MKALSIAKCKLVAAMFIFGTIGLFVRSVSLPSSVIALVRGVIGAAFLLGVIAVRRTRISVTAVRKNLIWLVLSGAFIGFNWILLFEAYRFTAVSTATLCYYMAPILVILVSPFVLREKLTARKLICVLIALVGMVCISGVLQGTMPSSGEEKGIACGLGAAVLYACVILMNKQICDISAFDKTIVQLGISALALVPYCLLTVPPDVLQVSPGDILVLFFVGIVHTGLAYYLYFGAMDHVSGQTVAIISYIDPVVAILVSMVILQEGMVPVEAVGAVLILGAAAASEFSGRKGRRET